MLIEGDNLISRKCQENCFTGPILKKKKAYLKIKNNLYYLATYRITLNKISVSLNLCKRAQNLFSNLS